MNCIEFFKKQNHNTATRHAVSHHAVWRDVGPLHGQGDTVKSDEEENRVVEPALGDRMVGEPPQQILRSK